MTRTGQIILSALLLVLIVGGGVIGSYAWRLNAAYNQAERFDSAEVFPDAENRPDAIVRPDGASYDPMNILLLGSDTRGEVGDDLDDIRGQRSDTILVVNIPADRDSINVMSIMRDNWVEIPGRGMNKINAAMAFGGVPLLIQTIENIIDVPIDHVAIIDFEGFKGLTEALDGVTVENPREFTSVDDHYFAEGSITLEGEQALSFVRERYAFPDGDYSRVANQQLFLKSLVRELLSRETLTSPNRIVEAVDAFSPFLTVDSGLTVANLVPLGISMQSVRANDMTMFTSPTLGTGMVGSASVVHPDWDRLAELAILFREDRVGDWQP
ncbi:transcriptional attenuator, LytR family [Ruaniaceae bacterium KH17]|nr:transcriptional attenuator, LytR family [Ruaniaceae bacterium KH17]